MIRNPGARTNYFGASVRQFRNVSISWGMRIFRTVVFMSHVNTGLSAVYFRAGSYSFSDSSTFSTSFGSFARTAATNRLASSDGH